MITLVLWQEDYDYKYAPNHVWDDGSWYGEEENYVANYMNVCIDEVIVLAERMSQTFNLHLLQT